MNNSHAKTDSIHSSLFCVVVKVNVIHHFASSITTHAIYLIVTSVSLIRIALPEFCQYTAPLHFRVKYHIVYFH